MKYVLRNLHTGEYLKQSGVWVSQIDDAMTFDDLVDAREFCQAHQIAGVQPEQFLMPYLVNLLTAPITATA